MSNKLGFRVVSTFCGPEQDLRWKVQQLADDDSEAKWKDASLGRQINLFEEVKNAIYCMNAMIHFAQQETQSV